MLPYLAAVILSVFRATENIEHVGDIFFFLCRIGKVDVQPHLEEMLSNLFHLLKVQGSQENEYVMKGTLFLLKYNISNINNHINLGIVLQINYLWLDFPVLSSNGL